jgi:CheY-like chemotaxis protein
MILERYLGYWGAEPSSRDSAPAALEALHQAADRGEPFQLAILDMQMPDLDGIELAQLIKGDATLAQTPLLMLSSMGYPGEEARRAGIIISLLKPVRQALLHEAVLKALGIHAQSAAAPSRHQFTPTRRFNARVLVAEDNPVNETVERLMMSRLGVDTVVAADGRQAVEMATKDRAIDLILMDVHMPVVSGIEAARQIREHEKDNDLSPIPIIAMTASALASDRDACKAVGMNDFLSKPLRRQALDNVLAQWLPRDRQQRPTQPSSNVAARGATDQELT